MSRMLRHPLKEAEEATILLKKFQRKAILDHFIALKDTEERDQWLLGLAGKAPPDLIESYSRLVMARDSWGEEYPPLWNTINLFVEDLRRRLDAYYDLSIKLYKGKIDEEILAMKDPWGAFIGLPEGPLFDRGKTKKRFALEEGGGEEGGEGGEERTEEEGEREG